VTSPAYETPVKIAVFVAFVIVGLGAVPLVLRLFLAGQRWIGNGGHPLVRTLDAHQMLVVAGVWSMGVVGLGIAMPFAIRDGFFGPAATAWLETRLVGRARGVLVVNVGMTVDEVRRRSTLPVGEPHGESLTGSSRLIADVVFDLQIGDTGTRFEHCRYYFVTTRPRGDRRVESMNVGVSPRARTRAELDEEIARARARLGADGWAPGRYVYRTPQQIALHGGKTSSQDGFYWLKGEALLHLEPRRVDDEQRGEDPATAGRWMLAVHIGDRSRSSAYEGLEFGPISPGAPR